jgi:uncharacterized protein YjbI with pentapeptide repeats
MARKQGTGPVLSRLANKRVLFQGKFGWGEEDRLKGRAEAQGATIAKALDAKVDYLVFPDSTSSKTVRQKANCLIAKGTPIQILEAGAFEALVQPTDEDLLALIRAGGKASAESWRKARGDSYTPYPGVKTRPQHTFAGESFDGLDLSGFNFRGVAFEKCSFAGAKINGTAFEIVHDCDFSRATGEGPHFTDVEGSRFVDVKFKGASFDGPLARTDFTGAQITGFTYRPWNLPARAGGRSGGKATVAEVAFRKASLPKAEIHDVALTGADFSGADLAGCRFEDVELTGANLRGATLKDGMLYGCKLLDADLADADLRGVNLADGDLSGSKLAGADLTGCNLRGATLDRADFKGAKGYDPNVPAGMAGPSLAEMDDVGKKAKRLEVSFLLGGGNADAQVVVGGSPQWGYHPRMPEPMSATLWMRRFNPKMSFSDALMRVAHACGHCPVRYETVQVSTTKSPKGGAELRELALNAIAEAFAQALPDRDALAAATKAYREKAGKKAAAEKKRNAATREAQQKKQQEAKAGALADLKKAAGEVSDFDSFMKAIVVRTDQYKVKKATKMLKAERFQLFNDVADTHVLGVVKSQTDPDLVYACRIDSEGHYACCTQNLNICGGLRGSVCKHLLVLLIGLAKAGKLDAATIDGWVARTHGGKPELDKETMGEIFIRYKGAEAGEVDWRPTETVPEDYYAL